MDSRVDATHAVDYSVGFDVEDIAIFFVHESLRHLLENLALAFTESEIRRLRRFRPSDLVEGLKNGFGDLGVHGLA